MELLEAIRQRRTVRKFLSEPVAANDIKELVRRALHAPSVANALPWKFIVVTRPELISDLAVAVHRRVQALFGDASKENVLKTVDHFSTIFEGAPAVIFIAMKPYHAIADDLDAGVGHEALNEMRRFPDIQSVGAAVQNLLLSAVDLGLGACWLSGLMTARRELEAMLDVQPPWELVTAVAVGKPESKPSPRPSPSIDDFIELME